MMEGPGADSEEKHEPVSDIDTAVVVVGLKALDPEWPIREVTHHVISRLSFAVLHIGDLGNDSFVIELPNDAKGAVYQMRGPRFASLSFCRGISRGRTEAS